MSPAPWFLAGPLLGVLIVGLRAAVNKPFGVLGGYIELAEHASQPQRLGISTFLLLGVVLGGALYAAVFGVFSPSLTYTSGSVLPSGAMLPFMLLLLACVAMGVGSRSAGGCPSGHALTGRPLRLP